VQTRLSHFIRHTSFCTTGETYAPSLEASRGRFWDPAGLSATDHLVFKFYINQTASGTEASRPIFWDQSGRLRQVWCSRAIWLELIFYTYFIYTYFIYIFYIYIFYMRSSQIAPCGNLHKTCPSVR
jgi:hypothetical protein